MAKQPNRKKLINKRASTQDKLDATKRKLDELTTRKKALMRELRELDGQLAAAPPQTEGKPRRLRSA